MNKKTSSDRVPRSRDELLSRLSEEVRLLINSCEGYDKGDPAHAKRMSSSIYQLCFDSPRKSGGNKSLLKALEIVPSMRMFSEKNSGSRRDVFYSSVVNCSVIQLRGESEEFCDPVGSFVPTLFLGLNGESSCALVSFDEWWNKDMVVIMRPPEKFGGDQFSRCRLVRSMRDMDGGAHTDIEIDAVYKSLLNSNYMVKFLNKEKIRLRGLVHAAIRQIAHELLVSLRAGRPDVFGRSVYKFPKLAVPIADFEEGTSIEGSQKLPDHILVDDWLEEWRSLNRPGV